MTSEPCVICTSPAELHIDDRKNRHIGCPVCGGYIATENFGPQYLKLSEETRTSFAAYMMRTSDKPNRLLFKTRPLKTNPYSAADGFDMVSISRIQAGNL